ncbi:mRNA export factor GLE1-like isoform X1 [Coffea arabica]|uniref:mRNA export factor GLE1 n=1 Tax=Coffea arabica TaxID=13443 RepID=A0A6P6V3G0_COFAR|nr:protein GLE1-like isoform X1 [Coffea arabica]XP_027097461.1 protein GLE1-like isoform X1 [Coffea arabica]
MKDFTLEVRYRKNADGIAADPQPDWSFDAILFDLNSLEKRLKVSLQISSPPSKTDAPVLKWKAKNESPGPFVMQVLDDEFGVETDNVEEGHHNHRAMVAGRRFGCDELSISDGEDSEDESVFGMQGNLMPHVGFAEGTLSELTNEHQLGVMEVVRNQITELETCLIDENEKFASTVARVENYTKTRQELDRKFDMQYQRRIAEALDNHLTAVQRDHEHKSQIEERRIRDDAVREEAQRRERALHEEKVRQEKIKAEAEMQARLEAERVEAAKTAALEAEKRAAEEAAQKKKSADTKSSAAGVSINATEANGSQGSVLHVTKSAQPQGTVIRSAENALKLEERRLQIYNEVAAEMQMNPKMDYRKHEQKIARTIRQISGSEENVSAKASELFYLIKDPSCPQSISITAFAKKFVSVCENPTGSFHRSVYAYARVIVLVTSKVPRAMDVLISMLNQACIYTVPKHIIYSKSAFQTKEAYYKAIGYREEDGDIESTDRYVSRLSLCVKLYAAIVQTELEGIQNLHGLAEGWAWLARFLNGLPPNLYTVVALESFLQMAGFAMYRRYGVQFKKILRLMARNFLSALGEQENTKLNMAIINIRNYLESNQFLQKPTGWELESHIESHNMAP